MDEYLSNEVDATIKEVSLSKANIVVICSSDEEYAQYACDLAAALKKKNSKIKVVIAGYPKEMADILKSAGVDDFIHFKVNVVDTLARFQKQFGIM